MTSITTCVLVRPTGDQVESIVGVVSRASKGDIILSRMTGCIVSLEAPLFRSMVRAAAAALEGTIYMVTDSDVPYTILSVGVCFQPDTRLFSSEAQRALGWNEFFEISQEARDWWVKEVCWSILPESRSLDHHAGSLESIGCSQQFTC